MFLAWLLFIGYTFFAIIDIKKAVIIWIPLHVLANPLIALKFTPPGISLSIAITVMLCFVFLIRRFMLEERAIYNNGEFILRPVLIFMIFSYAISYIFSIVSISAAFNQTIRYFFEGFILLYAFYRCLNDKRDLRLFIKSTFFIAVLVTSYGLYEFFALDNPVLDYSYNNAPHNSYTFSRMHYYPGLHRIRYGLPRCYSFFPLHLRFGAACVFLMLLFGSMYKYNYGIYKNKKLLFVIVMLLFGVFAANSKQGMVGMVVILFCFYHPRNIFSHKLFLIGLAVFAVWIYFPELFNNLFSLFDSDLAQEGKGSSVALRIEQYNVAWEMFKNNPIFGNGPGSLAYLKGSEFGYDAIRGAESIFLSLMPERGIIGCLAYFFMYIWLFYYLKDKMPKRILFFYLLTVFVIEVAGGRKDITLYWGMLIGTARYFQLYDSRYSPYAKANEKEVLLDLKKKVFRS